jgi:hypothetical protein
MIDVSIQASKTRAAQYADSLEVRRAMLKREEKRAQPHPGAIPGAVYAVYGRYHPASACRPASVIANQVTVIRC